MAIVYGYSYNVNGSKNGIKDDDLSVTSDNIEQMKSSSSINTNATNINNVNNTDPKKNNGTVTYKNKGASSSKIDGYGNIRGSVDILQGEAEKDTNNKYNFFDSRDTSQVENSSNNDEKIEEAQNGSELQVQTEIPTVISVKPIGEIKWDSEKTKDYDSGILNKTWNYLKESSLNPFSKKRTNYQTNYTYNRVSLNIMPLTWKNNSYIDNDIAINRINYLLGSDDNGLLKSKLKNSNGIIFPYTPEISMNFNVEYENSSILHSNLAINMYKNTPPSTIQLSADFTADTQENAEYMYAVIIFLRAMTKTDFGIKAKERGSAGMPPPVLYLNGWGNLCNNIPVVISSFDTKYDKESQYVYVENYDVWLPIKMSFTITLPIQPNLEKYKNQFDLNAYKNNTLHTLSNIDEKYNYEVIFGKEPVIEIRDNNTAETTTRTRHEVNAYKDKVEYSNAGWTW